MEQTNTKDMDKELEWDNLPNRITIFRMALVPVVCGCLLVAEWASSHFPSMIAHTKLLCWIAAFTFTFASITDFFDGYIARKRNIVTVFGSFLDPIADKFLVISSLILLQALDRVPSIVVVILVLREVYMTSLRLLASSEGVSVPVNALGKWKTTFQMIAIPMLMANNPLFGIPLVPIGTVSIYAASFLSLISALFYSVSMVRKIKIARLKKKRAKLKK